MLINFKGKREKLSASKLLPDNVELPFKYEIYENELTEGTNFLSNLAMTDTTKVIITSYNLDWKIKDVILVGSEKGRYQVSSITKIKRNLPKTFLGSTPKYDYVLVIGA